MTVSITWKQSAKGMSMLADVFSMRMERPDKQEWMNEGLCVREQLSECTNDSRMATCLTVLVKNMQITFKSRYKPTCGSSSEKRTADAKMARFGRTHHFKKRNNLCSRVESIVSKRVRVIETQKERVSAQCELEWLSEWESKLKLVSERYAWMNE
jgi:hypothetical protein